MAHGFFRVAAAAPTVRIADPPRNAEAILKEIEAADKLGVQFLLLPEASLTGATCGDLFFHQPLLNAAEEALRKLIKASEGMRTVVCAGLPLALGGRLYNAAAVFGGGRLYGLCGEREPRSFGATDRGRYFSPAPHDPQTVPFAGFSVPFASRLIFDLNAGGETFPATVAFGDDPQPAAEALLVARPFAAAETVGAAEFVLGRDRGDIMSAANERAADGYRVLALVSSPLPFGEDNALPDDVTLEGFVYIADKIRKEAPDTLKFFRDHGVAVKIISGDNPATVSAVARRAGLADYNNWVDMSTLKTEDEVREAALVYTVFGRVLPDQKLLLVKALKAAGHTVAMTGDGVNDVLALKESDCSVAMASGSDAAKNVSSIVLLDSNFASMPRVVAEGRRSINNLERSASLYLAKTIYNVLIALIFMAVPAGLPFEPKQLTLIGGITIGLPSCVLALEPSTELVKGRSLTKMLCKAVPGGIAVALAVAAATVAQQYFLHLNAAQLDNLYVLVTTITGLIFLFRVCLPFNLLHGITYVVMIGLFAAVFLADIPFFNSFFGISRDITAEMGKAIAAIIAVIAVIYVTVSILTRNLDKTIDLKLNEKMKKKVSV